MYSLSKPKDVFLQSIDNIVNKLDKMEWISNYEVFLQNIDHTAGTKENQNSILINKKNRSGVAIRIITKSRRFVENAFGTPTLSNIDNLEPPKSTIKEFSKDIKFPNLAKPQRISILGDQSRSLVEIEDLIYENLDGLKAGYTDSGTLIQHKYTLELENRAITNTGSRILFNSSSRIHFETQISKKRGEKFVTLVRKDFGRNTKFLPQKVLKKAEEDIEIRFQKQVKFDRETTAVILHPEVLGRIISFHSSNYLVNPSNIRENSQIWNDSLSLFDDPLQDNGMGSEIIDDEGSITRVKKIVENGYPKESLESLQSSSWQDGGNAFRAEWFQPFLRSYQYPIQKNFSNLMIVGGIGKGELFTQRSGEVVLVKRGHGYVGGTLRHPYFIVHTSEAELWKNGNLLGPVNNFAISNSIDKILKNGDLSADLKPVIDPAIPGSVYVGWLYLEPNLLKPKH